MIKRGGENGEDGKRYEGESGLGGGGGGYRSDEAMILRETNYVVNR